MKIVVILAILSFIVLIAAVLEIIRETHDFSVTYYETDSDKLKKTGEEIRAVFISDLHNRCYGVGNEKLINAVRKERPDLILIGGDMLVGKADASYETALDFVRKISEIAPVYYGTGNHEGRMKAEPDKFEFSYGEYKRALEECGVIFLENEVLPVQIKGQEIVLCGLELPLSSYKKFRKAGIESGDIGRYLAYAPENDGRYTVLMAHNPAYMDAYLGWGADLVLSGHLHGGLVRVPCIGGVVTPQGFLFPKYSGEMTREGAQTVIVSRGLGTHTLNIRLFNMPELIALRINSL